MTTTQIGSGLGDVFRQLGAQKLAQAKMAVYGQQLVEKRALDSAHQGLYASQAALNNTQDAGLQNYAQALIDAGAAPGVANAIGTAVQANRGANFNTTGQGLGRMFQLANIGKTSNNAQAAGTARFKTNGGVTTNVFTGDTALNPLGPSMIGVNRAKAGELGAQANAQNAHAKLFDVQAAAGGFAPSRVGFGLNSNAPMPGDPTKHGEAYIASLPANIRDAAVATARGDLPLPSAYALRVPQNEAIRNAAFHINPMLSSGTEKSRAKMRSYMTVGKGGQSINAINTAAFHLLQYVNGVKDLHEGGFTLFNKGKNWVGGNVPGALQNKLAALNGIVTKVGPELAAAYGHVTDSEIAAQTNALPVDKGTDAAVSAASAQIGLLLSKLESLREQSNAGMSGLNTPLAVINPKAADALQNIMTLAKSLGIKTVRLSNGEEADLTGRVPRIGGIRNAGPGAFGGAPAPAASGWSIQEVQ